MRNSKWLRWVGIEDAFKVLFFLFAIMASSVAAGAFILHFLPGGGLVVVWDLLGSRIHLNPSSVALLIVASLSAEIFTVINMRKPSRRLEAVVILLFTTLTAGFALLSGRYFLLALMQEAFPALMLLLSVAVFAGVYVLFLVLIDATSEPAKNLALAVFSVTTGAFIATSFQTWIIVAVLIAVVVIDIAGTLAISPSFAADQFEPTRTALTTPNWAIGLGDLLSYSIVATHAYLLGGFYLAGIVVILVIITAGLTLRFMRKRSLIRVPGLPLTLAPSVALVALIWLSGLTG